MTVRSALAKALEPVSVPYIGGPLDGTFHVGDGRAPLRAGAYRLVSVSTKEYRRPVITRNVYLHENASHEDALAFVRGVQPAGG